MFKKLIAVFMALTMAACTAAPVYADPEIVQGTTVALAPLDSTAEIGGNGENENSDAKAAVEKSGRSRSN